MRKRHRTGKVNTARLAGPAGCGAGGLLDCLTTCCSRLVSTGLRVTQWGRVGHHGGPCPIPRRCGASCAGECARGTASGLQPFLAVRSPAARVAHSPRGHCRPYSHLVSPRDDAGRALCTRCKATPLQTKPHGRLRMPSASKSSRMTVSAALASRTCVQHKQHGANAHPRLQQWKPFVRSSQTQIVPRVLQSDPSVAFRVCAPSRTAPCRVLPRLGCTRQGSPLKSQGSSSMRACLQRCATSGLGSTSTSSQSDGCPSAPKARPR